MTSQSFPVERFTDDEQRVLLQFFTNVDQPVFALINLPEVVKGALFARYSRSSKSLRRLFLDEFVETGVRGMIDHGGVGAERAEKLYRRVFDDFGDDSVAQLGGAHLACEGVSNILTKVIEWGRLMAYLEQSTRYVPYTDRPGDRWRYHIPAELPAGRLSERYVRVVDDAFSTYARWIDPIQEYFRARYPKAPTDSDGVYRLAIRAKALDTLRGLLPAATRSNVGVYGTAQSYELLLLRMRAHPLAEARQYADLMLAELRKVIPAFLSRVDQETRGGQWSRYLADTRAATEQLSDRLLAGIDAHSAPEVSLTDFDPEGETKVVAAVLYPSSELSLEQLLAVAQKMSAPEKAAILRTYRGDRKNRRHKPGRAFEGTSYRFDVLTDYGAFRDLQRHRMLTLDWQTLSTRHGYVQPDAIAEAGASKEWSQVMRTAAELHDELVHERFAAAAPYVVPMAYRVRFFMELNAREAMHMIELRTTPQGHPAYRRVCQAMHRLIAEKAGHRSIADAMVFVDHTEVELERLASERRQEEKRTKRLL